MLGPKIQGERIKGMLADSGLVLQYGYRRIKELDETGNTVRLSTQRRIYRAVEADKVDAYEPIIQTPGEVHHFPLHHHSGEDNPGAALDVPAGETEQAPQPNDVDQLGVVAEEIVPDTVPSTATPADSKPATTTVRKKPAATKKNFNKWAYVIPARTISHRLGSRF